MSSKQKRLSRIFNESGKIVLVPLDHGMTLGPIKGIKNMKKTITELTEAGVDALLLHKGEITSNLDALSKKNLGVIMHLSASTVLQKGEECKILTGSVEEALCYGCDAVSVHVNLGSAYEKEMMKDFAKISSDCNKYGMPLLAMLYTRGEQIKNECDVKLVQHAARVAEEMGADIVKVNYTGDKESFKTVVDSVSIPVLIAGGSKISKLELIGNIYNAISVGGMGVSIGRNVFQADDMKNIIRIINDIVNQNLTFEQVVNKYEQLKNSCILYRK